MKINYRKSMANVFQFLDNLDIDCIQNQSAIINKAKDLNPFSNIVWSESTWDITSNVQHKIRGHESRKKKNLNFYKNVPNQLVPLEGHVCDVIKALVTLRFFYGGQGAPNLQRFIDGWRYIYDQMETIGFRLELLNHEILNAACRCASNRLSNTTAYNIHKSIHEISDLIDKNKLSKMHLEFRYSGMKRPDTVGGIHYVRLDDVDEQKIESNHVASENVLEALGLLYQKIPQSSLADRVRILLITIAVFTGRRIGEILTMPASPIKRNDKGTAYITIYPQKWASGDMTIRKANVPIPSACVELIENVLDELLAITEPVREVGTYIHKNKHADYRLLKIYEAKGWMSSREIEDCFGISKRNGGEWARQRGLTSIKHPNHTNPRAICWPLDLIKKGMNLDIDLNPVLTVHSGNLYHKDCIAVLPLNAAHSNKASLLYAVRLIDWQQISDFLGSNTNRRNNGANSVFDKYFSPEDAARLFVNSHAFRHLLNTLLDEGGMSDAAQTKWFGRKNPVDTKAYQKTSPLVRALLVRKDLLNGSISGPVADQIKSLPIDMKEAFIKARIKAVHDVGPGLCFHDFSQTPCERSLQCSANCDDFHWRSDDKGIIEDVKRQYAIAVISRNTIEAKAALGRGKSRDWLAHNEKKLTILKRQMMELGIEDFDVEKYLNSLKGDDEQS